MIWIHGGSLTAGCAQEYGYPVILDYANNNKYFISYIFYLFILLFSVLYLMNVWLEG